MVEVTYQIVLSTIQTVSLVVGIIYYITTLRNNQRSQQLQLETRKAQLYMQLFLKITSEEFIKNSLELIKFPIGDVKEFMEKYMAGPDSTLQAKLFQLFWHIDGLGYMISQGLIDPEMVYNFGGGFAQVWHWKKWEPVILSTRKLRNEPEFMKWFEYTASEMMRIRQEKGLDETPSIIKAFNQSKQNNTSQNNKELNR
jgi:hypothetical protein